jgi:Ca2+-binding RTX toxin-like protein
MIADGAKTVFERSGIAALVFAASVCAALAGCTVTRGESGGLSARVGATGTHCPWVYGGADDDRQAGGRCDDYVYGGIGSDEQEGGPGRDILIGGSGDDVQRGGAGDDVLIGGADRDTQFGNDGDDVIIPGTGGGVVDGGPGNDTMILDGRNWKFDAATGDWVHEDSGARIKATEIETVRDASGHEYPNAAD